MTKSGHFHADRMSFRKLTALGSAVFVAVLLLMASVIDWLSEPYPLSDAHWDCSVYLLRARSFAEGGYLGEVRGGAPAVYDSVMRGVYPTPYWAFMRLGNTILLGTVVALIGPTEHSIHLLTWTYRVLLAAGLFFAAILPFPLVRVLNNCDVERGLGAGVVLSVALYLCCDVASYMSGNLVSEVPAILFTSLGAWCLVKSFERNSMLLAVISGCCAFLLYVVRMESVWILVAFFLAMGGRLVLKPPSATGTWKALVVGTASAGLLFLAYSWLFFPLTDPRLAVKFSEATAKFAAAEGPQLANDTVSRIIKHAASANGLLWVGALLGLPLIRTNKAYQFAVSWFLIALVPVGIALAQSINTQTRVYTTLTPVLMLLSALGWAHFLSRPTRVVGNLDVAAILVTCAVLLAISQPASYSLLRKVPGMWRLQYVREYLAPMPFERVDFHLAELSRIADCLRKQQRFSVVVASPGIQAADHIMIIQYLLAPQRSGDEPRYTEAHASGPLLQLQLAGAVRDDAQFVRNLAQHSPVLLLGTIEEQDWFKSLSGDNRMLEVMTTHHYLLIELVGDLERFGGFPKGRMLVKYRGP